MKKKILAISLFLISMLFIPDVLAVSIKGCQTVLPNAVIDSKIPNTVHTIIVAIKIAAPILLVIFGMIDLLKAIMAQKEDEIKKGKDIFIKRLITAIIIYFVIAVVQFIVSFVAGDEPGIMECANCFINGVDSSGKC